MRKAKGVLVVISMALSQGSLQAQVSSGIRVGATNVGRQDRVVAVYDRGTLIRMDVELADAPAFRSSTFPLSHRELDRRFREDDSIGSIMRSLVECADGLVMLEGEAMRYVFRSGDLIIRYERRCSVGRLFSNIPMPRVHPTAYLGELLERCIHGQLGGH